MNQPLSGQDLSEIKASVDNWHTWLRGVPRETNDALAIQGLARTCDVLLAEVQRLREANK